MIATRAFSKIAVAAEMFKFVSNDFAQVKRIPERFRPEKHAASAPISHGGFRGMQAIARHVGRPISGIANQVQIKVRSSLGLTEYRKGLTRGTRADNMSAFRQGLCISYSRSQQQNTRKEQIAFHA